MNDFDFHYMHYTRSEELIKDAENERLARSLIKAAKETRRAGTRVRHDGTSNGSVAQRVARALGRKDRPEAGPAGSSPRNEHAAAS
ncbi:hypothetical protein [Glycomyces harbinensis]|uniref:Uncharacterized protein n=1 Tax=Glycomyces harbinensis TaxID=58114 RepID=A0A1G6W6A7_9ACTN|nr:hypothetical protein [Glycomyces harbinensis]SDD60556.1 hypothetical protein SAMN05216270_105294 [Glycomyces harbinensis]